MLDGLLSCLSQDSAAVCERSDCHGFGTSKWFVNNLLGESLRETGVKSGTRSTLLASLGVKAHSRLFSFR
jgi:hypothetical protein